MASPTFMTQYLPSAPPINRQTDTKQREIIAGSDFLPLQTVEGALEQYITGNVLLCLAGKEQALISLLFGEGLVYACRNSTQRMLKAGKISTTKGKRVCEEENKRDTAEPLSNVTAIVLGLCGHFCM